MTALTQDLLHGLRILRQSPGVAAVATLTLTLGIGANAALFSVVNGVLLNPLPYPRSDQLVTLFETRPGVSQSPPIYLNFLDWQRQNQTFSSLAIYRNQDYNVTGLREPLRVAGYMISSGFFSTLGVHPVLGRTFQSDDDQIGAAPVVLLGGGFWGRQFGASPDVIGKTLTLNGASYTIVGVIPAAFTFYGHDRDVYTPIGQWNDPSFRDRRISVSAHTIGRMKPGVTLPRARADMDVVARNLAAAFPVANQGAGIALTSMKDDIAGNVQPLLFILLAAVGFLLLIACTNVANLLLARAIGRSREFAVRAALGAGKLRLVRQLLTESLLLAGIGGALGLLCAFAAVKALRATLAGTLPRAEEIAVDGRLLLFTVAVTLCAAVVFGLAPAMRGARTDLQTVLKQGGRGTSAARHHLQRIFVAVEVAMALVLLIGAGLMLRSLDALWRVNPGYNPTHALTFNLSLPSTAATTSAETRARLRQFDDRLQSIPGVQAVSVTLGSRPMIHDSSLPFWIDGRPKPDNDNQMPAAMFYLVEAGFQQAMGITLQRGRFITPEDNENTPIVIDIDEVFARSQFPGENPIGKRVNLTQFNVQAEIVGVVGHIKQWGPGADEKGAIQAQFFYPFMQLPEKLMRLAAGGVAVVLRFQGDPSGILRQVRRAVEQIDRRELIYGVHTMDDVIAGALAPRKLSMIVLVLFAAVAAVLSCVGIFGVISYLVGHRTNEIGVRMALGAQPSDVAGLVLWEGAKMTLLGVALGIAAALALTRLIANQLFGVTGHDPITFLAAPLLVAVVALFACYVPARRAARVDPIAALRCQ